MINKAKNQFSEHGFIYLLWDWVILICNVSQFIWQYLTMVLRARATLVGFIYAGILPTNNSKEYGR